MTTNPTAPCARPGCGAPPAWHTNTSTLEQLGANGGAHSNTAWISVEEGYCVGRKCTCKGYIAAPEPPQPERTAYVVELSDAELASVKWVRTHAPVKCLVRDCEFYTAFGICTRCQFNLAKFTSDQLMAGPQLTAEPARKCIISDCPNTSDEGQFVGDLCFPCSEYLSQWGRWQLKEGPKPSQPATALCICGGREDEHGEDGRCSHDRPIQWADGKVGNRRCYCTQYRPAVQP